MDLIVRQNKLRVYLGMAAMTMILGVLGSLISWFFHWGLTGTGGFLIVSGIINLVAYFFSDRMILRSAGARELAPEEAPELFAMARELSQLQQVPVPRLALIDDDGMNAFATGRDPEHAVVAVTRGLLEKLTPDEVRAVLGHELAHVRNYDIRLMAVVAILAGLISILADMYWAAGSRAADRDRSGALAWIGVLIAVSAPLGAMLVQLAISRRRELLADACACTASTARHLVTSLQKIQMDRRPMVHVNPATAHLYFSSPYKAAGVVERLFSTHPSIEERVAQLEAIARGETPGRQ